jgi:hypothetical protein
MGTPSRHALIDDVEREIYRDWYGATSTTVGRRSVLSFKPVIEKLPDASSNLANIIQKVD